MAFLNESHIEEADIQFFEKSLHYRHLNAWKHQLIGRDSLKDVVIKKVLRESLQKINPTLPADCLETAVAELTKSRIGQSHLQANKDLHQLLLTGIPVEYTLPDGSRVQDYVKIIDFEVAENNDFLVVSQLSIERLQTENKRRPDLLIYVNGLPLVMIELKNATKKVKEGYDDNLQNYRRDIPQLFWYNLLVCISNGIQTRVGSYAAPWEHFFSWTRLRDTAVDDNQMTREEIEKISEQEDNRLSLQLFCEGLCHPQRLLDYLENFVLFHRKKKVIAKNHQFLGVNNAIESLKNRAGKKGKLGVFWHTQGAGKSYSMIFFSRKVERKITGNWSFLILTDRRDLDDQIYRNFIETGVFPEPQKNKKNPYRPQSREDLRQYLQSNKSFVFSLIQKFGIAKGKTFPQLTDRDNWIVMVDEAHRTQYKGLGENLRIGLPNAQFMAFTGTPLFRQSETANWFGENVSEYNFLQSIEDGATVPIFYRHSVPRMENINEDLVAEAAEILENADLTDEQKRKLDREYSTIFEVVKRPDRLEEIATHIVRHYPYRLDNNNAEQQATPMKAMVVCIDKFTAVRMFDKVQTAQRKEITGLRKKIKKAKDAAQKQRYQRAIDFMRATKMAVVVSQEGSETEERLAFDTEGLDIKAHRRLMEQPDDDGRTIEDFFKDPFSPYRIVFVTAMWLTGFDAPTCSTMYLDKPMQNHGLMQAIARTNRVVDSKTNGLIVDYFGVFRNLKKAFSIYAEGSRGKSGDEDLEFPVKDFSELLDLLREGIEEAKDYCRKLGADMEVILKMGEVVFNKVELFRDYANLILAKDEYKTQLSLYVNTIVSLYDSSKPDIYDFPEIKREKEAFEYLRQVVYRQQDKDVAIEQVKSEVTQLLDTSIVGMGDLKEPKVRYVIENRQQIDLSRLDFAKLREEFPEVKHQAIQFTDLRELLEIKLTQMLRQNCTRGNFLDKFEDIIENYNNGSMNIEEAYAELIKLGQSLTAEQERAARNDMTEAEQELFDLLQQGQKLNQPQEKAVKRAAKMLLKKLHDAKNKILIREWHRERATQEMVRRHIQDVLDQHLPEKGYNRQIFSEKLNRTYQHFYDLAEEGRGFVC